MTTELLADGHLHLFNAGFLPIEGVLRSRGVWKWAAEAVADLIESKIERDWPPPPHAQQSARQQKDQELYERLEGELKGKTGHGHGSQRDVIGLVVDSHASDDDLAKLGPALRQFRRLRARNGSARTRRVSAGRADDLEILEAFLRAVDAKAGPLETRGGCPPIIETVDPPSLVEWILLLLMHESRIERAYSEYWDGNPKVGLRVHLMMDMECHYPSDRVLYRLPERHRRMLKVQKRATSPLLGFAAFDPFRKDWQTIIAGAINAGFSGVKFYPPTGYRPIGNVVKQRKEDPSPAEVDRRNLALFHFCVDKDIPLFTHCTKCGAMESVPNKTGEFADPAGWRTVLETEGLRSLRLCFGHAGGQEGWFGKNETEFMNSYAGEVFRLCTKFPNVYCDFGFFDCILDPAKVELFATRLAAAIEADPKFGDKCCFGTDWHMVSRLEARPYVLRFQEVLRSRPVLRPYEAKFFGVNLLSYLKNPAA